MTVSKHPGAKTMLRLLESLKTTVIESATAEEKLDYEFRVKFSRERQRREEATQQENNRLAADTAAADEVYQAARQVESARHTRFRDWISRARTSSKDQSLERIENRSGSRKYGLQKKLIESEKNRDAELAANVAEVQEFNGQLAAEGGALTEVEKMARNSLRGYTSLSKQVSRAENHSGSDTAEDEEQLLLQLRKTLEHIRLELRHFGRKPIPLLFRFLPVWLLLPLSIIPIAVYYLHVGSLTQHQAIGITAGAAAIIVALYVIGLATSKAAANDIAKSIGKARALYDACLQKSDIHYQREIERIQHEFTNNTQSIDEQLRQVLKDAAAARGSFREVIDDKTVRVAGKNDRKHRESKEQNDHNHAVRMNILQDAAAIRQREADKLYASREAALSDEQAQRLKTIQADCDSRLQSIYASIADAQATGKNLFPLWDQAMLEAWVAPKKFEQTAKFGEVTVDVEQLTGVNLESRQLKLPGPAKFTTPLLLSYPDEGSILFETANVGREQVIGALNNIILRLLATAPPGRLSFTIIDPVGLGQNFAGIMHLADYGEQLINSKIWTQSAQIEEKLADLNEHMEKVIQMYLRNEYASIADYNEAAGNIAERYQFLVIADFPGNFSEVAAKRLLSIAQSGARCGVYTLIHWDHRLPKLQDFVPEDLRKSSVCFNSQGNALGFTGHPLAGTSLTLDPPPNADLETEFIHEVGKASRDSSRVEVPFSQVTPPDSEIWSEDTTSELRVPIGRTGATKLQYMAIGKGTRQHALIAGKTGSGKSTLFHVMITNLALWCSPEQVEFYLVDFKKGVEFKCYAAKHLPHARVVAIESDREFGLSVLQRVDDELKKRGEMFRKLGVQDIAGYKRMGGKEAIPRSLLMIDEFQELFVEDDKISQGASVLLDRIVRQGRAFGIHVILGSQTLGGAYTVARTTLGQMVIRIALQCNEADAYLIMDESNPAPRLLTRPGEGIYNDSAGAIEGNSPFQTVWLSDQIRDEYLEKVHQKAVTSGHKYPGPLVFEGDAPADVRENAALQQLLDAPTVEKTSAPHVWLGAPNSIKGPTEAIFHRQSGNNLLIVGQREEAALTMIAVALISLAAQYPVGAAQFYVFDGSAPGSPQREYLERVIRGIPHNVTLVKHTELTETMNRLAEDVKKRSEEDHGAGAPEAFLLFHGLQKFNKLRHEDDFSFASDDAASPGAQLNTVICEGTSLGYHVLATLDTYNNVNRFFNKKAFSEFEMRVMFQMSASDSSNLSDSPKAGNLGLHRALFFNEQEGYLETFRPYALPSEGWLEEVSVKLAKLLPKG
jgi:S-DNA-T family DNA segregation ATPase FtsK/SpoIIIE